MPRQAKGPRLWLQPARDRDDGTTERAVWVIRDGASKRSTGAGARELETAERALADYILSKNKVSRVSNRDPSQVRIADVITIYSDEVAKNRSRPHEISARLDRILGYFGTMTLSQVSRQTCAGYVEHRGHTAAARRELEDMRAAINHHRESGLCNSVTPVTLPERSMARERWLTRNEVARLVRAAWRYREQQNFRGTDRHTRRHIARFILVAAYTGTRAGAICAAALEPTAGCGWVDLENGVFYRRAMGVRETRKRQTPVRLPPRLLAHIRRWKRRKLSLRSVVEWNGVSVKRINKAFRGVRTDAGFGPDVTPHTFRHTCATWLAQSGVPPWEAAGFLGMTVQTFEAVYGHHHPDHQHNAVNAFKSPRQRPDRLSVNETGLAAPNVVKMHGKH